ncbi:MAG: hypothetical protein R3232_11775, partial [Clostridia bacterium]|nr:hypothetical protein [Clostridia bacterium]
EPKIKVYIGRVTEEMVIAAEELDVPIGRMVLAVKAQEEGAEIDFEAASMLSVQELQRVRNLYKTINKATELISSEATKGNGKMKQIEAMTNKILREIAKLEDNLAKLQEMLDAGEGDADTQMRFDVLNAQLEDLLAQLDAMGIAADAAFEEVLNGMSSYKDASPEEKARIREEMKAAKKEENQNRIEEHLANIKSKVDALKNAVGTTGDDEDDGDDGDPDNGDNGNPGGKGKGKGKGN